jgi:hypothetical protein
MHSKFIVFLLFILISINSYSTEQYPDRIIYKGTEYMLFINPLEKYFSINPEKRPKINIVNSASWRGYEATFEILNNELYLKDINIEITVENSRKTEWVSVLQDYLNDQQYLKLDWFSGVLVIPYGEQIKVGHMGYNSIYENYILLEIDSGNLLSENRKNYIELNILEEIDEKNQDNMFYYLLKVNKIIIFAIILFLLGVIIFVLYKKRKNIL